MPPWRLRVRVSGRRSPVRRRQTFQAGGTAERISLPFQTLCKAVHVYHDHGCLDPTEPERPEHVKPRRVGEIQVEKDQVVQEHASEIEAILAQLRRLLQPSAL